MVTIPWLQLVPWLEYHGYSCYLYIFVVWFLDQQGHSVQSNDMSTILVSLSVGAARDRQQQLTELRSGGQTSCLKVIHSVPLL